MEIEIVKEFDNPLLGRKEYTAEVKHDGLATPKRVELRKRLAAQVNANLENMILIEIKTRFGIAHDIALFHVYDDPENLKRVENEYLLKRNGIIE